MTPSLRGPYTQTDIFLLFMYIAVFLVGTVGNAMVIQTFYANQDQPGSRFVLILAIVDVITCIWTPVIEIGRIVNNISHYAFLWPFGKVACYLQSFHVSLFFSSAWLLVAICLERMR